jgi:TolB protein
VRAALLFALTVARVAAADDAGLAFVHANGRVAYQRHPTDPNYTLFGKGREPALSPDGKRLLYWADGDAKTPIDQSAPLVWADLATGQSGVWRPGNLRSPAFSPDGKIVVWCEMVDGRWTVMRANPDGKDARPFYRGPSDSVFAPSWQPDGHAVLVGDLETLFWVALDGTVVRKVPLNEITSEENSVSSESRFRLSPTNPDRLLYSADVTPSKAMEKVVFDHPSSALFIYDLKTRQRTRLTGDDVLAEEPVWSRDGTRIYFHGFRIATRGSAAIRDGLLKIDADGKNLTRITAGSQPGT